MTTAKLDPEKLDLPADLEEALRSRARAEGRQVQDLVHEALATYLAEAWDLTDEEEQELWSRHDAVQGGEFVSVDELRSALDKI